MRIQGEALGLDVRSFFGGSRFPGGIGFAIRRNQGPIIARVSTQKPWMKRLLLAKQEGAVAAAFAGSAAIVDHAVGDKGVVARDLPDLNVPLADLA